jgi:hypothetical protein
MIATPSSPVTYSFHMASDSLSFMCRQLNDGVDYARFDESGVIAAGRYGLARHCEGRTTIVVPRLNSMNFPVFSRRTGKRRSRDEFAEDCLHRQTTLIYKAFLPLSVFSIPKCLPC